MNSMTKYFTIGFLILFLIVSCENENHEPYVFKAGDNTEADLSHELLTPPLSLNLTTISDKDTILNDSLFLDINGNLVADFIFIVQQRFTKDNLYHPIQTITVKTNDGVLLQLMPETLPKNGYLRTISLGDTIDTNIPWITNSTFFLTQIRANFREAPRITTPYLPFKYTDGRLGWLLMDFEDVDSLYWNIKSFSILEFCIKETR